MPPPSEQSSTFSVSVEPCEIVLLRILPPFFVAFVVPDAFVQTRSLSITSYLLTFDSTYLAVLVLAL